MKARIEPGGMLVVTPESVTEEYALDKWYEGLESEFNDLAEGAFKEGEKSLTGHQIMLSVEELITCKGYKEEDDE